MSRQGPRRELITASAGSGKTFQLTDRYIGLLLLGEPPESIVALTFSRKAAGEFFDAILKKLADAASDPCKLAELNENLGVDEPAARYREKLAELLGVMHRLTLGTLDSFFHSILSRFPLEHGLGGTFSILDSGALELEVGRALEHLYRAGRETNSVGEGLGASFRMARAGSDDRKFAGWLAEVAMYYRTLRCLCGEEDRWGGVDIIWKEDAPWRELAEDYDPGEDLAVCRDMVAANDFSDPPFADDGSKLDEILYVVEHWSPRSSLTYSLELLKRLVKGLSSWKSGKEVEVNWARKDYKLREEFCEPLSRIVRSFLRREFERRIRRTRGAYEILSAIEEVYDEKVRSRGGLTFADFPLLLGGNDDPLARLEVEFRLDGQFRHWLLDEFQDTSPAQWRVLENLVEEAIHDPEDARAFFCVGDVKQAIYGWRGGDSRLFDMLRERYSGRLEESALNYSWRSGPDVLGVVNEVFGNLSAAEVSCTRWANGWEKHEPSPATENLTGHVAWWIEDEKDERKKAVGALLRDVDPVARGLSCAILTQKRKTARELVDFLRLNMPDMPVENEVGANPGSDNPFSVALLSLFRAAAHPRDRFSRGHLKMTPFFRLLAPDAGDEELSEALLEVLRQVHAKGFAPVARRWGLLALAEVEKADRSFARVRLRHFEEIAGRFDESGSRDVDAFVEFAKCSEAAGRASEKSVRVMTIHKSKGLTFDLVILPELDGNSLYALRRGPMETGLQLFVRTNPKDGEVDWTLDWPTSLFAEADETLAGVIEEERGEACFENLCKLYVGMTRPRQGLYLFSDRPKEKSTSLNYLRLLNFTLGAPSGEVAEKTAESLPSMPENLELRHSSGSPDWFEGREGKSGEGDQTKDALFRIEDLPPSAFPDLVTARPSGHGGDFKTGESLFGERRDHALDLGTEVHALFEKIEWLVDEAAVRAFLASVEEDASTEALVHLTRTLEDDEARTVFASPEEETEVWRERNFSMLLDGKMVNGTFDRVVLQRDSVGNWSKADIIDFKTDRGVEDEAGLLAASEGHRPQQELYRKALSRLTRLPEASISLILLFTNGPRLRHLSA